MARIHANVVAIDPGKEVINMAQQHLLKYSNTNDKFTKRIIYKNETIENHLLELKLNRKYDAVVVSEVLEHVNDKVEFLKACTDALKVCQHFSFVFILFYRLVLLVFFVVIVVTAGRFDIFNNIQ